MKEYKLTVKVGDLVEVGRFRNVSTKIKKIELDEKGQPVIITNKGKKKMLSGNGIVECVYWKNIPMTARLKAMYWNSCVSGPMSGLPSLSLSRTMKSCSGVAVSIA